MNTTRHPQGDPLPRAYAAYYRSGGIDQPASTSGTSEYDGRSYIVLENADGVLAVYRILTNGALKRMKRWPAGLTSDQPKH